jgi:hypothetical protein
LSALQHGGCAALSASQQGPANAEADKPERADT